MTTSVDWEALRAEDAASRRLAQQEFARPVAIQAGAGTGKTATLVARVLAWSLGPGWERASAAEPDAPPSRVAESVLRRIVAITFTEAAAAEMDGRIDAALAQLARGERPQAFDGAAPPERVAALRGALDQLVVQTIHAWCRRLLGLFPMEARLHPLFEVDADGSKCAEAVRDVVSERLGEAYARDDETALALAAAGAGPREIEQTLFEQLQAGATAEELADDPLAPARIEALRERLAEAHEALALTAESFERAGTPGATAVASALAVARALVAAPVADAEALDALRERLLSLWDTPARNKLAEWKRPKFAKKEEDAFGARCAEVTAAASRLALLLDHLERLDLDQLARVARVLAPLAAEVEERLRRRGRVTFEMLLSRAAALLAGHPDVAARLRAGIDQLLVDEFQDTDPRQCAIVAALALQGPADARPGLFVVGDPKQSIYGWRHADLAAYEGLLARMEGEGGRVGSLCVNHRSVPAILDEVERVVRPVMRRAPGLQPAFEPLAPSEALETEAGFEHAPHAPIEHWLPAELDEDGALRRTRSPEATALEAEALARELRGLHERHGVRYADVGVLFRSRGDWDVYLTALREAGVPFAVEGDRSYYRRREIIDAAAWVRCVLDPNDSLALVSALRSAAVGVPDAAWVPLFARGLPERVAGLSRPDPDSLAALRSDAAAVAAALPADVPGISRIAGWERNLAAALAAIGTLRASFASDPADVFVEKLRAALLLEASEAARFLGPWRVANLERFFRDLSEELAAGADEQDVLRRLRHAVAEEEEMQEEPPHDSAADAVQILTLHGAKGLDFDHVYLMQLHKGTGERRDRPRIDAARVGDGLELRVLGAPSLLFDQVAARRAQVADAERVRLLYVGMTRARERLVLSGAWPAFLQRKTPGMHSLLLEQRRELPDLADLTRRLADAARAGRSCVDVAGARFVLPVLRVDAEPEPAPVAGAARAEEVAMDAASVIARQRDAEARMARPLGGVASAAEPAGVVGGAGPSRPAGAPPPADAAGGSEQREIARLTGIAVHRAFERLDLTLPAGEALTRAASRLELPPGTHALPAERTAALAAARRLLDGVAGGGRLCERLDRIRQQVVARELPVLLPPDAHDDAVGFVSGTLDLVYRDPDTARFVVVDVKTDAVADDAAALAALAARHARQGEIYRRALREGLGLATEPRFELWFVAADRWIASDPDGSNDPGDPRAPEQMSLSLA